MHFLALCNEIYFLANFFLQTNHLRKFLEFRVGMGIVDNMIAKCKFMTIGVLVQLMDLICLSLKRCNSFILCRYCYCGWLLFCEYSLSCCWAPTVGRMWEGGEVQGEF
jgi:hypothetical protein